MLSGSILLHLIVAVSGRLSAPVTSQNVSNESNNSNAVTKHLSYNNGTGYSVDGEPVNISDGVDGSGACDETCTPPAWFPCGTCPGQSARTVCASHGMECAGVPDTCGENCNVFSWECHWDAKCCNIGKYCGVADSCCGDSEECASSPPVSNLMSHGVEPHASMNQCCIQMVSRPRFCYALFPDDGYYGYNGEVDCNCWVTAAGQPQCDCIARALAALTCDPLPTIGGQIIDNPPAGWTFTGVCSASCCSDAKSTSVV